MRRLLRDNTGFTLAVLLCLLAPVGVRQARQSHIGTQATAKEHPEATQLPLPLDLIRIRTARFPIGSPSGVEVGAKCDSHGNIYAVWSDSGTPTASEPVRKLAGKSREIVAYRIPTLDGYGTQFRSSFNLSADGRLFVLVRAQPGHASVALSSRAYFIEKFHADGSFDSRLRLEDPPGKHFEWYNFAVFGDGRFLVLGMAGSIKAGNWRPFAGIFDPHGQFMTQVKFARASGVKYPGIVRGSGEESDASAGSLLAVDLSSMMSDTDGDVYITLAGGPMQVIAVSPSGEVEKEIEVKAPAAGLVPAESGIPESGYMYIHFRPLNGAPGTVPAGLIGVINLSTGQYDRLYKLPASAEGRDAGVCGDSQDNFLVIEGSSKGKLTVAKYSAN